MKVIVKFQFAYKGISYKVGDVAEIDESDYPRLSGQVQKYSAFRDAKTKVVKAKKTTKKSTKKAKK